MTVPTDTTYPANATDKAWQKKKGFLDKAKAKTKTGLGATLITAEKSWKAIPWKDLDASALTAVTPQGAERLKEKAEDALEKVKQAKTDLDTAEKAAKATKGNKNLSKPAALAAAGIETDLGSAIDRLDQVKLTDFDTLIEKVQSETATNLRNISVSSGKAEVMTGATATWDRKVLKVSGVVWKKGTANDIKDKTVVVSAEKIASAKTEGGYLGFQNDMKLDSASGNTATFKSK